MQQASTGRRRRLRRRWAVLAGLALILVAGLGIEGLTGGAALATSVVQPNPQGPPIALASAVPRAVPPARLIVLGDSVASGAGCGCAPFGQLFATSLASSTGRAVSFTNAARDGLTTQGLLDQLQGVELVRAMASATLVTVTIGANDFDPDLADHRDCLGPAAGPCYADELASFGPLLQQVLNRIHTLAPRSRILITGYWNVFLDGAVGRQHGGTYVHVSDTLTRALNSAIAQRASAAGATYVDLYTPFETRSLDGLTALLASDGDHPSASGHQLISNILLNDLRNPNPATP